MKETIQKTPDSSAQRETPDSIVSPKTSGGTVIESYERERAQKQETYESILRQDQDFSLSTSLKTFSFSASARTGALYEDTDSDSGGMGSEIF